MKLLLKICLLVLSFLASCVPLLQAYRDEETGTFLTRDPAGFIDGPNLYVYVNQNPWTKFDPLGLQIARINGKEMLVSGSYAGGKLRILDNGMIIADGKEHWSGDITYNKKIILQELGKRAFEELLIAAALSSQPSENEQQEREEQIETEELQKEQNRVSIEESQRKGKEGEELSKQQSLERGEEPLGDQITFQMQDGKTSRTDQVVKTPDGKLKVIESKNGPTADLSPGQESMLDAVENGQEVTPQGKKAESAGFTPGKPVKVDEYQVDRHND